MRVIAILVLLVFCWALPVSAIVPVNAGTVTAAIDYGTTKVAIPLEDFFLPWTAYEETADRLSLFTDRACLYTPFLLMAADARDKTGAGQPVNRKECEKTLKEYKGYLVVGLTLFGPAANFAQNVTVVFEQGGKRIKPHSLSIPREAAPLTDGDRFALRGFVYFRSQDINLRKPVTLSVTKAGNSERRFYFNLPALR